MKLKLAIAASIAALALPMSSALAGDAIPGTCFETNIGGGGGTTTFPCECLVGVPFVTRQGTSITLHYCIANI